MNNKINIPEFQVSEFNSAFKDIIETNFNYIRIKGEISEIKTATKGQIYLTLKDKNFFFKWCYLGTEKKNI